MQRWSLDGVRQERTGWRCSAISERHRKWGFDCPAVDLDFVLAEYNYGLPVALIEYKERHAQLPDFSKPSYKALKALADGYKEGAIPFLVATYDAELWWFSVSPINDAARQYYRHCLNQVLTEQRFVRGLLLLRKKVLTAADEAKLAELNTDLPREAA